MDSNPLYLHLMLGHVPVIGTAGVALLLAWGLLRHSADVTRVGLALTAAVAVVTIAVYLTGNPAARQLRDVDPTLDRHLVHEHEALARAGFIAVLTTGAAALAALWIERNTGPVAGPLPSMVLVALLVCFGLFVRAALAGSQIRHPELRPPIGVMAEPRS